MNIITATESDRISIGTMETVSGVNASTGVSDAGKVVVLDASGLIDDSMLPAAGSGDMLKSTYDPNDDGVIAYAQLTGVAASTHTHAQSDITNLTTDLAGKASTTHTHAIADTTGLQTALDAKQATVSILEGLCTANVTITTANTFYYATGATVDLTQGTWLVWCQAVMGRTATTATRYTGRIRNTSDNITVAEGAMYMPSVANHYFTMSLVGMVVVASGTKTVRIEGTANQSTSCVIHSSVATNGSGTNVTTKIYAVKLA